MPTIAENKKLVKEVLHAGPDHDEILANLQQEIDKHNQIRSDAEEHLHRRRRRREKREASGSDLRFRFKDGVEDPRERRSRRKHIRKDQEVLPEHNDGPETSHPFPREPAPETATTENAFLSSLLDALADDEAAAYWESVYSQPIHAYSRPSVRTEQGELEQLNDEEYAAWVKQKMWEKQHPEIMVARDKAAQKHRDEEAEKQRRKDEFIRQREREAWTHASRQGPDTEYVFDFEDARNTRPEKTSKDASLWADAWTTYLQKWEKLKTSEAAGQVTLPWPTLASKSPSRPNVEDFMLNMPLQQGRTRQHVLKAERVRWHPDKIQQRFQGKVDEDTMKVVTSVFQIIDAIWAEASARN